MKLSVLSEDSRNQRAVIQYYANYTREWLKDFGITRFEVHEGENTFGPFFTVNEDQEIPEWEEKFEGNEVVRVLLYNATTGPHLQISCGAWDDYIHANDDPTIKRAIRRALQSSMPPSSFHATFELE